MIRQDFLAFFIDRQARGLSVSTVEYYERELEYFNRFLIKNHISRVDEITANNLRLYFIELRKHRNKGGVHAAFRAIRAFLNWWQIEYEEPAWRNPIKKIKLPGPRKEPIPGIPVDQFNALLATCNSKNFYDLRDKAIFIVLLDTGLRRMEFLSLDYGDIDMKTGQVNIRKGKGSKKRIVFLGVRARRELIRYLRLREDLDDEDPVWTMRTGDRIKPAGLRQILRRRSIRANIPEHQAHDFRRAFAIESLRNGIDLITLMHLMGHTSTVVLQRYLKLVESDLHRAHSRSSPADNL